MKTNSKREKNLDLGVNPKSGDHLKPDLKTLHMSLLLDAGQRGKCQVSVIILMMMVLTKLVAVG